jgi:hypothetical protein
MWALGKAVPLAICCCCSVLAYISHRPLLLLLLLLHRHLHPSALQKGFAERLLLLPLPLITSKRAILYYCCCCAYCLESVPTCSSIAGLVGMIASRAP